MRRMVRVLPLAAAALLVWLASPAAAQDTKTARGTVTAMAGEMVTVKAGAQELKFTTDAKTSVTVEGGGTATREAAAAGKPGPSLSSLIKVGDAVEVSYVESGGALRASRIRRVRDAGAGGGRTSDEESDTVTGLVESIAGNTLTISGSRGGGVTFKQSFTVDNTTKVIAVGASTAAAPTGGKLVLTEFVGAGDRVTVTYRQMKDMLHANEIRVREKAKK